MTDPALLFREEALRSRQGPAGPWREEVPVSPAWTARAYWALLVLLVAGLTGSALIRVGEFARGPAVVHGRVVEAAVPAVFASELRAGLPLELTLPGCAPVTVIIASTGPEVAGAGAASRLLGTGAGRAGRPAGSLMMVRAAALRDMPDGAAGTASVKVGSQPVIVTLVTGLAPQSGAGDG
jgi:hypothetical protein